MSERAKALQQPKQGRAKKVWIWSLGVLLVLILILAIVYQTILYKPSSEAKTAMTSDETVTVSVGQAGYRFEPASSDAAVLQPNVIFYPGGLVDPKSYAPFARELAEAGHRVYIATMPFNLAFMGQNKADAFISEHPEESYVIGGHSLGGVFASRYAAEHLDQIDGVFFLAAYAEEAGSLADVQFPVLQMTATKDGVLNREEWGKGKRYMPNQTEYITIEGGNHAQFGSYGSQKGDNAATITLEEQQKQVISGLLEWMKKLL
ncbi:alpha/beta hydrolase [Paenibacillus sp. FSL H8-0548]|uniref:alpha/beta hydrolase n=1 Tax=Paenibacillus sp. FSL H8-0548 TaxID=1920422 RepID=UPI00096CA21B|nr:alpha/beta hydrolase [Paenibacillus sp. FSL H8-0548]OMF22383.1 alpha/beta hydrolase [Paenibacillus sp. FSL H8-0548]